MRLPVGGRTALVLGGVGHRSVHGGRDRVALGAAVGLPVLAARAVPAGVEQHPVVAPGVAALLTLGQAPGQQPAHRVGDRTAGAQLLVQAPHEPVGEHLGSVRTACEALHPLELTARGDFHQAAGGRTVQPCPDQVDRSQDCPQIPRGRGAPPLLPALTRTVQDLHRPASHGTEAGLLAADRRGLLWLLPAARAAVVLAHARAVRGRPRYPSRPSPEKRPENERDPPGVTTKA